MEQEEQTAEAAATPFASYPLKTLAETRAALLAVLRPYRHVVCTPEYFECLVSDIMPSVPVPARAVLRDSVADLAGQRLLPNLLVATVWRLAGNLRRLAAGEAVPPWTRQRTPEWAPVRVLGLRRALQGKNPGYRFVLRFEAGGPAGMRVDKFWSTKFCYFVAPQLGFSNQPPKDEKPYTLWYEFRHPREFVGLTFYVLVSPSVCRGSPGFTVLRLSATCLKDNREMMRKRTRYEPPYVCPRGYPATKACHRCAVGYVHCPAACHKHDYVVRACIVCNKDKAVYDVDVARDMCLECYEKRALRGE